jgi:Protein kinase domain
MNDEPRDPAISRHPDATLIQIAGLDAPRAVGSIGSIEGFDVIKVIGVGGMGVVLLVRQQSEHSLCALKLLRPEFAHHASVVHRFLVEARHMRKLEHPNIVRVESISESTSRAYYTMPYFPRGALSRYLTPESAFDTQQVLKYAIPVADAIHFAHERGIIHRDLKPANILLSKEDEPLVCDFGLVRTVYNDSIVDPSRELNEGSAPYMSPAAASGIAEDTRCDIYAFGATLYEMLTGHAPYEGRTSIEVLRKIREGAPRSAQELNPRADKDLVAIASRCMARHLRDRYASMSDVLDDLKRVQRGEKVVSIRYLSRRAVLANGIALAFAGSAYAWRRVYQPAQKGSLSIATTLTFPEEDRAWGVGALSRNNAKLALFRPTPRRIEIWDVATRMLSQTCGGLGKAAVPWYIDFNLRGDRLSVSSDIEEHMIRVFDVGSGQMLYYHDAEGLMPCWFGQHHDMLVLNNVGSSPYCTEVRSCTTFEVEYAINDPNPEFWVEYPSRPNNHGFHFASGGGMLYYARSDGISTPYSSSTDMSIAVVSRNRVENVLTGDRSAVIRRWIGSKPIRDYRGHEMAEVRQDRNLNRPIRQLLYVQEQRFFISQGEDNTIRGWETETGRELWKVNIDPTQYVAGPISEDGQYVPIGASRGLTFHLARLPAFG